jgi:hypothetical protein
MARMQGESNYFLAAAEKFVVQKNIERTCTIHYYKPNGESLSHIHTEIVCPGQCGNKLEGCRTKTPDNSLSTANKDEILSNSHTISTCCLKYNTTNLKRTHNN